MDIDEFWAVIEAARAGGGDETAVSARASALLAERPPAEIMAAHQRLREVLAAAYRSELWAVGYLINGGCSDDGSRRPAIDFDWSFEDPAEMARHLPRLTALFRVE